ncbi:MAG: hypothetical protein E7613_01810 [Ruminococcaceae bacterium]|nr:hypothetical protein [Oscillospiraceae bacterium]
MNNQKELVFVIRIGVVNIDCSHPLAFARELNKGDRARYTAVFNDGFRGEDEVNAFVKNEGLEKVCHSASELAECTDVGFIQGCDWDKHIGYAMEFINRGKPVFIDKPIVGNTADCKKIIDLEKSGAVILGASSARYCNEVREFLSLDREERGDVLHIDITVGVDEFNYAIHAIEALCEMAGNEPISVKYVGRGEKDSRTCDTFFVEFEGGATGLYHSVLGRFAKFSIIALTTKDNYTYTVDNTKLYKALLDEICNKLEGKENNLASMERICESIRVALAGKYSMEHGGVRVEIDSPLLDTVSFDGAEFVKGYAAASSPMYL